MESGDRNNGLAIDRILESIEEQVGDYRQWSAWAERRDSKEPAGTLHRCGWDAVSELAARVIVEHLWARGMHPRSSRGVLPGGTVVRIERRPDGAVLPKEAGEAAGRRELSSGNKPVR